MRAYKGKVLSLIVVALLVLTACGRAPAAQPAAPAPAAPAAPAPAAPAPATSQQPAAPAEPAGPVPPATPVPIRIGHGFAAEEPLWLMAAKPDLTPNQGVWYTLEMTPFRAQVDRFNAFQAGELDGGTGASTSMIFAWGRQLPVVAVGSLSREAYGQGFSTGFLALEESGIRQPSDLKGKTIGIVDHRSATDLWARTGVEAGGLNHERDVRYVIIPFPAMGEALRTNKIDAGAFPQPFHAFEMARGGVVEVMNGKTGVRFDEELMLLWFGRKFLTEQPDVVRAFMQDFSKVATYYAENPVAARQALLDAGAVQTPPEVYLNIHDWARSPDGSIDVEGMARLQELMAEFGWVDLQLDLGAWIDRSYFSN